MEPLSLPELKQAAEGLPAVLEDPGLGLGALLNQAIVTLAHTLGMDVIAEGVETAMQLEQLRALKVEYGQGYYFARPLDSLGAEMLLRTYPHW